MAGLASAQWFAIFDNTTGALMSVGTDVDAAQLPANLTASPIATQPDFTQQAWNPTTRAFAPIPATKVGLEPALAAIVQRIQMYRAIATEATNHGDTAIATAANSRADTIYANLKTAIVQWQAAQ